MFDLEPPKPTKEFHEAYMEIYGKGKKREEKKEEVIPKVKQTLADLDLPPLKLDIPDVKHEIKLSEKKQTLADLDLPPLKLDLPDVKPEIKLSEKKPSEKKPLFSFMKRQEKKLELPELDLSGLDEPPVKAVKIPEPAQALAKPTVRDFLAEVKNGKKTREIPIFSEHKESVFEESSAKKGARDVQFVFEKTHPFETAGHEFLEKIQPVEKRVISCEELPEFPKSEKFKSRAEFNQYVKKAKDYEQKVKKLSAVAKKDQQAVKVWLKKQELQEIKINEKMKKMDAMEKELHQMQDDAKAYEPKLQELYKREDAMLEKERELKQRQEDIHDTEQRLVDEENAILAKIKTLEADQKLLEKEQDAIAKTVAKLEKEKAQVVAKTREFSQIMKKISDAEKELKQKVAQFTDRDEEIKKKERMIEKDVARVDALKRKAEKLKDMEQTYERLKRRLRDAYQEYENKFAGKEAYALPQEQKPAIAADTGDITNLITATKQHILNKKYEEANRNINKLMQRYMQIPENNPRKKEIYYDILGIKNLLKLDLLE
jgi:uncharacterized protein (DUF3084 family)